MRMDAAAGGAPWGAHLLLDDVTRIMQLEKEIAVVARRRSNKWGGKGKRTEQGNMMPYLEVNG